MTENEITEAAEAGVWDRLVAAAYHTDMVSVTATAENLLAMGYTTEQLEAGAIKRIHLDRKVVWL